MLIVWSLIMSNCMHVISHSFGPVMTDFEQTKNSCKKVLILFSLSKTCILWATLFLVENFDVKVSTYIEMCSVRNVPGKEVDRVKRCSIALIHIHVNFFLMT